MGQAVYQIKKSMKCPSMLFLIWYTACPTLSLPPPWISIFLCTLFIHLSCCFVTLGIWAEDMLLCTPGPSTGLLGSQMQMWMIEFGWFLGHRVSYFPSPSGPLLLPLPHRSTRWSGGAAWCLVTLRLIPRRSTRRTPRCEPWLVGGASAGR